MPARNLFETTGGQWLALTAEGLLDTGAAQLILRTKELKEFDEWMRGERQKLPLRSTTEVRDD